MSAVRTGAMAPVLAWALVVSRVGIGAVFLVAGALKFGHAPQFAAQIAAFGILPQALVAPAAIALPFVEMLVGLYLVVGLFTRYAALAAFVLAFVFDAAIASAVIRGLALDCGCFGQGDKTVTSWAEVGRDFVFVLLAAAVAVWPPTRLSVDARLLRPATPGGLR